MIFSTTADNFLVAQGKAKEFNADTLTINMSILRDPEDASKKLYLFFTDINGEREYFAVWNTIKYTISSKDYEEAYDEGMIPQVFADKLDRTFIVQDDYEAQLSGLKFEEGTLLANLTCWGLSKNISWVLIRPEPAKKTQELTEQCDKDIAIVLGYALLS